MLSYQPISSEEIDISNELSKFGELGDSHVFKCSNFVRIVEKFPGSSVISLGKNENEDFLSKVNVRNEGNQKTNMVHSFEFTQAFPSSASNRSVAERIAFEAVGTVLEGFSVNVMGYSCENCSQSDVLMNDKHSVFEIAVECLLAYCIKENGTSQRWLTAVSFIEITDEKISDGLRTGQVENFSLTDHIKNCTSFQLNYLTLHSIYKISNIEDANLSLKTAFKNISYDGVTRISTLVTRLILVDTFTSRVSVLNIIDTIDIQSTYSHSKIPPKLNETRKQISIFHRTMSDVVKYRESNSKADFNLRGSKFSEYLIPMLLYNHKTMIVGFLNNQKKDVLDSLHVLRFASNVGKLYVAAERYFQWDTLAVNFIDSSGFYKPTQVSTINLVDLAASIEDDLFSINEIESLSINSDRKFDNGLKFSDTTAIENYIGDEVQTIITESIPNPPYAQHSVPLNIPSSLNVHDLKNEMNKILSDLLKTSISISSDYAPTIPVECSIEPISGYMSEEVEISNDKIETEVVDESISIADSVRKIVNISELKSTDFLHMSHSDLVDCCETLLKSYRQIAPIESNSSSLAIALQPDYWKQEKAELELQLLNNRIKIMSLSKECACLKQSNTNELFMLYEHEIATIKAEVTDLRNKNVELELKQLRVLDNAVRTSSDTNTNLEDKIVDSCGALFNPDLISNSMSRQVITLHRRVKDITEKCNKMETDLEGYKKKEREFKLRKSSLEESFRKNVELRCSLESARVALKEKGNKLSEIEKRCSQAEFDNEILSRNILESERKLSEISAERISEKEHFTNLIRKYEEKQLLLRLVPSTHFQIHDVESKVEPFFKTGSTFMNLEKELNDPRVKLPSQRCNKWMIQLKSEIKALDEERIRAVHREKQYIAMMSSSIK